MIFKLGDNTPMPRVAIIGGGFSGTMVLAQLVQQGQGGFAIDLFEQQERPAQGVAYSTPDAIHLLNVRAGRMGAFAGQPQDFFAWLESAPGAEAAASICPDIKLDETSFLPRKLYGAYLRDIFDHALEKARQKGIEVQLHHARVIDAALHDKETERLLITFIKGGTTHETTADALVLATGNLSPRAFGFQAGLVRGAQHYVADVWNTPEGHIFPAQVNKLSADDEIVVIGTGLTMVDTVLTLKKQGFKGTITALSRSGLLPAVHSHAKPYAHPWAKKPASAPKGALGLLSSLRAEVKKAAQEGYDWRDVIDALRPVTQTLWQQLPLRERRKFLSRLLTLWSVHRHRMAPEIHSTIRGLQQSGGLKVVAGKIYYVGSDDEGLTVAYRKRGKGRIETIRAALVLNCTGPEYDIAASGHSLLQSLRDRELITIGPLRIGIELTAQGTARGRASESIFPMGTLLVGEKLECTAVPELREQAGQVTQGVLRRLAALRDSERKIHLMMGAWI